MLTVSKSYFYLAHCHLCVWDCGGGGEPIIAPTCPILRYIYVWSSPRSGEELQGVIITIRAIQKWLVTNFLDYIKDFSLPYVKENATFQWHCILPSYMYLLINKNTKHLRVAKVHHHRNVGVCYGAFQVCILSITRDQTVSESFWGVFESPELTVFSSQLLKGFSND